VKLRLNDYLRRTLFIVGSGGHGLSLASVAIQSGFRDIKFISLGENSSSNGIISKPSIRELLPKLNNCSLAIAVGDNFLREKVVNEIFSLAILFNVEIKFPNIVHPKANVANSVEMGQGNQLFPLSNLGESSELHDFIILNHLSSLDHHSVCCDYSSLAPGSITGGNVNIGRKSALLISSCVSQKVTIGEDSILAANSFLKQDIPDLVLFGGSPAKLIRTRKAGERYM
jgi:acetyltransferase-like isoleucine patch superfamily enzyme